MYKCIGVSDIHKDIISHTSSAEKVARKVRKVSDLHFVLILFSLLEYFCTSPQHSGVTISQLLYLAADIMQTFSLSAYLFPVFGLITRQKVSWFLPKLIQELFNYWGFHRLENDFLANNSSQNDSHVFQTTPKPCKVANCLVCLYMWY